MWETQLMREVRAKRTLRQQKQTTKLEILCFYSAVWFHVYRLSDPRPGVEIALYNAIQLVTTKP